MNLKLSIVLGKLLEFLADYFLLRVERAAGQEVLAEAQEIAIGGIEAAVSLAGAVAAVAGKALKIV